MDAETTNSNLLFCVSLGNWELAPLRNIPGRLQWCHLYLNSSSDLQRRSNGCGKELGWKHVFDARFAKTTALGVVEKLTEGSTCEMVFFSSSSAQLVLMSWTQQCVTNSLASSIPAQRDFLLGRLGRFPLLPLSKPPLLAFIAAGYAGKKVDAKTRALKAQDRGILVLASERAPQGNPGASYGTSAAVNKHTFLIVRTRCLRY